MFPTTLTQKILHRLCVVVARATLAAEEPRTAECDICELFSGPGELTALPPDAERAAAAASAIGRRVWERDVRLPTGLQRRRLSLDGAPPKKCPL